MSVVLVGSSGYLGRHLSQYLPKDKTIYTHNSRKYLKNSIKFDFFKDDLSDTLQSVDSVILSLHIEDREHSEIKSAMIKFLKDAKNCRVVYLSSDGIFDGKRGCYKESFKPNPITKYGHNLKLCEDLIREYIKDYLIVRPSYIYSIENEIDKRLQNTMDNLLKNRDVTLFEDMYKRPMDVTSLAKSIVDMANSSFIGTLHIAGERLSVYDFHYMAMKKLGIDTTHLKKEKIYRDDFLKDTSLDTTLWKSLKELL